MPRKKKTEEQISQSGTAVEPKLNASPVPQAEGEAPSPQGRRKKALGLPSEGAAPAPIQASPVPPPPSRGSRRKKVEGLPSELAASAVSAPELPAPEAPAPEAPAPKKKGGRASAPKTEDPQPEPAAAKVQAKKESAPKPKAQKPKAQRTQPEPPAEPVAAVTTEAAPAPAEQEDQPVVIDLAEITPLEAFSHTFRPRKPLPAVLGEESEGSAPVTEIPIPQVEAEAAPAPAAAEVPEEVTAEAEEGDPFALKPLTFTLRTPSGARPQAQEEEDGAPEAKPAPRQEPQPENGKRQQPGKGQAKALFRTPTGPAPAAPAEPKTAPAPVQAEAPASDPEDDYPAPLDLGDAEERNLTVVQWRPRGTAAARAALAPPSVEEKPAAEDDSEQDSQGGRRRRRRRGRRDERDPVAASAPLEIEDEAEVQPEPAVAEAPPVPRSAAQVPESKPQRPRIVAPVDAPQVVLRGGIPSLVIDRKVVPPLFFSVGYVDGKAEAAVLEQAKMAAEQGVNLFGVTVKLEPSEEGVEAARHSVQTFIRLAAQATTEAKVLVRVEFAPIPVPSSRGWAQEQGSPSLASDSYWSLASEALGDFCKALKGLPILGIHLDRNSWHFGPDEGFEDTTESRAKFGEWLRHRYRNDVVSLRASWFDGRVEFNRVEIPDFRNRHGGASDFVRLDRRARRWVDYHLFLSDLAVERIIDLARTVKEASEGRFLVGASYGYTFEWSHPGSGHLSLGKLLRCPEVDYVAGPPSYKSREPGSSGASPWPIDSFALSSKLALSEEDFRTSIGRGEGRQDNPLMKTPQALESAHWRGVGAVLAHGGGLNWMDAESQGWLSSRGIWERAKRVSAALTWRSSTPMKDPDIAVLIDERSLAYLADERAFTELVQDVRESVLRSGLSVGFYLLSDLAHRETFPEAKVHVFVNAWDIRPEVRSAIKARLQRDNKVLLWLYSAGLFEGGRESLVRAREVTGIALRPQPFNSRSGTSLLNVRDPLCRVLPDETIAQGGSLEPSYFAIPEDATVLGEYTQTGLPSFVVQRFPKQGTNDDPWTSIFLGEPVVSAGLFRALGQMAGAHVWCLDEDVLHVRPPFLTIHCRGAGVRTLTLPDKWSCYDLIQGVWMPVENSNLKFLGLDGATHSFLVGHRSEIEAILASPSTSTLTEEEIKAHQDNTIQWDSIKFDVPIMKLDEWVEESWGDDLAEDFMIKPSMIDEIEETPEEAAGPSTGRNERTRSRRDRDKNKRGRKGGKADPGQKAQEEVQTVNFLFRKRE